jgi:hypothetical protein
LVPPVWAIPIGVAFIVMSAIAIRGQRSRIFYALAGVAGLISGLVWLSWTLAYCGYGRPRPPDVPDMLLTEAVVRMFSFDKFGHAPSSILACLFCCGGLWFCTKVVRGSGKKASEMTFV